MDIITEVKPAVKQPLDPSFLQLAEEAWELHGRLLQLQAHEQPANYPHGRRHPGNPARVERLQRLVNMTVNRWYRRMGCKLIYSKDGRERVG